MTSALPASATTTPAVAVRLPVLPAVVEGTVRHRRRTPVTHDVRMDTYSWLVDVDDLPRFGPLASFRASDHFGGEGTLRERVLRFATAQGAQHAPDDRIVMLAGARTLGYVFDPLSVFWCIDTTGALRWAILEIHNTYGERHAQLIRLDARGKALVDKEFYVSPFFTVEGEYDVALRLEPGRVLVVVNLRQGGRQVFSASLTGRPTPATWRTVLRATLRTPAVMHQTTTRIKLHGIRLWLRRLPITPRSPHTPPKGMS